MERYHAALMQEIQTFAQQCGRKLPLDTIYIGGGTPSTWPDHLLLDTFGKLKSMFEINDQTEVTIEVNPGTVRIEQFELWKQAGINRISAGVQSLKDEALHKLNRMQSSKDVYFLLEHASKVIENISVDFILGLPDVSPDEWKTYLNEVVNWPINHMSMYFLMVHEQTPLYFKVKTNVVRLPKDETVVQLY
jgi:oxygen-independent coproporphyrinogen-3 oxidase